MPLTIGGTSVNPGSWASAVSGGVSSVASGNTQVSGLTQQEAQVIQSDLQSQEQANQQQQFNQLSNLQQFDQANPKQQNQFLNQVKPSQVMSYAEQADQAQMSAALSLGTDKVPQEVLAKYQQDKEFREKRAEQVERGAKGTDVIYRDGVKSPLYAENVKPQILIQTQSGETKSTELLFSPITQEQLSSLQTSEEFRAANAPGVVGGASLVSGGYFTLREVEQPPTQERQSIFKLEPAVNQYGNVRFRETISGAVEYGAERISSLSLPTIFPAFNLIPSNIKQPAIKFGSGLLGGAASGALLISPFGLGEAIGTIGNTGQQTKLVYEFGTASLFGVGMSKISPLKTGIPQYQVSSTGFVPYSTSPTIKTPSTRLVIERAEPGYIARSTTEVPIGNVVRQNNLISSRVVGEYTDKAIITRTASPFSTREGSFVKIQEVSQTPIGSFTKVKVQQFSIKIDETAPQRQFVSSDATIFNMPKTFPRGVSLTSQRYEGGVLFKIGGKDFVYRQPSSDFASGGAFKPGTKIFVSDEFGSVSGVSEVPIKFREPPIGGKPGSEAKIIPPGNYNVNILRGMPKQTMGIPSDIRTVQYSPVAKSPKIEPGVSVGKGVRQQYEISQYDKPIAGEEIQAMIPRQSTMKIESGIRTSQGVSITPTLKVGEISGMKYVTSTTFQPSTRQFERTNQRQPDIVIPRTFTPSVTIPTTREPTITITPTMGRALIGTPTTLPPYFPPTFEPPTQSPPRMVPPSRPPPMFGGALFPDMSGSMSLGKPSKKDKGRYQPSFIALSLGIKQAKGSARKSELTGFDIRGIVEGKKSKQNNKAPGDLKTLAKMGTLGKKKK